MTFQFSFILHLLSDINTLMQPFQTNIWNFFETMNYLRCLFVGCDKITALSQMSISLLIQWHLTIHNQTSDMTQVFPVDWIQQVPHFRHKELCCIFQTNAHDHSPGHWNRDDLKELLTKTIQNVKWKNNKSEECSHKPSPHRAAREKNRANFTRWRL